MTARLLRGLARAVARLPRRTAMGLAALGGGILAHGVRLRRSYVLETLARCFPEKSARECRAIYAGMCRHQAANLVELLRFAGGREEELGARLDVSGEEIVRQALARGKGCLILIAHYGNYDLMGLFASKRFGYPVTIITKTLKNQALNHLWWELRQRAGVATIPANQAYRPCVRALRQNGLVGFMLDQNRPNSQGIYVNFFGRPACTTPGLAFMAAQTGAPVVPVFMRRTPEGRHRLEARPLLEPPPDRKAETLQEYTATCTRIIEDEIRRHPDQWLWFHKRWKSQPPGSGALTGGETSRAGPPPATGR